MKTSNKWLASMAVASVFAASAASADSGLYVGGSVGSLTIDETFDGIDLDSDSTAYRFVGGIQLSDMLGLELGYQNFGNIDDALIRLSADGWTLGGTLGVPLSENLSLFGRAGVFFWDADVIVDGFSIDTPGDENPYYGAGLRLDLSRNLSVIGDWSRFELDDVDTDVLSVGLQYRFGS